MTDPVVDHRGLLFTVAYEMLGSVADAEDVVQEAWLRWAGLSRAARTQIRDERAYLVRVVTRQALNRLRTISRRREEYVGEWLPEPVVTSPDVADDVELAESVSLAMLTVLQTLSPVERAVFVLREVFEVPYGEIARAVDKSVPAVRQVARRARDHVAARRPRVRVSRAEQEAVVARFLAAMRGGDLQRLMEVLAPDVVVVTDGGGKVEAAIRPISGQNKIRQAFGLLLKMSAEFDAEMIWLNGEPAIRIVRSGRLAAVAAIVVENGRIVRFYAVANPDKLTRIDDEVSLSR